MKQHLLMDLTFLRACGRVRVLCAVLCLVSLGAAARADEMPPEPKPVISHGRSGNGSDKATKSACLNTHDARQLVERGEVIPVHKALQSVRARLGGEVVKVRLCPEQAQLIYYLTLLDKNSQISVIALDARTGQPLARP
jgi:hypothetical protein